MRTFILFISLIILTGCGNLQLAKVAEVPVSDEASIVKLSENRPLPESISPTSVAIPGKSLYFRGPSGNSAWFFLLGIPGMIINSELITQKTQEIMSSGDGSSVYAIDALAEAKQVLNLGHSDKSQDKNIILKPYILLYVKEEGQDIQTIVGIRVERELIGSEGKSFWAGQYNYALPDKLPYNYLETTMPEEKIDNYKNLIHAAFVDLKKEIDLDLATPKNKDRKIALVKSSILRASRLGFPGFVVGDIETDPKGKLVLRLNSDNWGAIVDKEVFYVLWVFPNREQYTIRDDVTERSVTP